MKGGVLTSLSVGKEPPNTARNAESPAESPERRERIRQGDNVDDEIQQLNRKIKRVSGLTMKRDATTSLSVGEEPPDCGQKCRIAGKITGAERDKQGRELFRPNLAHKWTLQHLIPLNKRATCGRIGCARDVWP